MVLAETGASLPRCNSRCGMKSQMNGERHHFWGKSQKHGKEKQKTGTGKAKNKGVETKDKETRVKDKD